MPDTQRSLRPVMTCLRIVVPVRAPAYVWRQGPPGRGRAQRRRQAPRSAGRRGEAGSVPLSDHDLVAKMLDGDANAFRALEPRMQACVWTTCLALSGQRAGSADQRPARAAFRDVWASLAAESFRCCDGWSGREPLETYLVLVVRDLLQQRIWRLLSGRDTNAGWSAFQGFFDREIRAAVVRLHDNAADREDAYNTVLLSLWEEDCRRLRVYSPPGSFAAHVRRVVDNLLIDERRRAMGRRRLPAGVQALAQLDQAVFSAVYWNEVAPQTGHLLAAVSGQHPEATAVEVDAALDRVRRAVPPNYIGGRPTMVALDPDTTGASGPAEDEPAAYTVADTADPYRALAGKEDTALLGAAGAALRRAAAELTDQDRAYVSLVLGGLEKPRDIARGLGDASGRAIYVIKERVRRRLLALLAADPDVKAWLVNAGEGKRA